MTSFSSTQSGFLGDSYPTFVYLKILNTMSKGPTLYGILMVMISWGHLGLWSISVLMDTVDGICGWTLQDQIKIQTKDATFL